MKNQKQFELYTKLFVCDESECPLRGPPIETHPKYGHCKAYPCIKKVGYKHLTINYTGERIQ